MRHRSLMRMLCNPARSPFRASNRFPGGTFSSSSVAAESIWTSLRTAARAIEFQRRLTPVSKSALVCFSAKLLITPFSLYNEFRYTASVMPRPLVKRCRRPVVAFPALSPPDQKHRHFRRQIGLPVHLAMARQEVVGVNQNLMD